MKSDNTVNVAKAYQHPMFKLTPEQEAAIDDFVNDAITRYESSECGKPRAMAAPSPASDGPSG